MFFHYCSMEPGFLEELVAKKEKNVSLFAQRKLQDK